MGETGRQRGREGRNKRMNKLTKTMKKKCAVALISAMQLNMKIQVLY